VQVRVRLEVIAELAKLRVVLSEQFWLATIKSVELFLRKWLASVTEAKELVATAKLVIAVETRQAELALSKVEIGQAELALRWLIF
jgi:hypothetical protein